MKFKTVCILGLNILIEALGPTISIAQQGSVRDFFPDIKVIESAGPSEGYFFMGSKGLTAEGASHYIAIVDNYGTPVFFRKMDKATSSIRLLGDGRIAYLNGVPRKLFYLNNMLEVENNVSIQGFKPNGHDWDISDDGHILLMGEASSMLDMSQLVEGGNAQAEVLDVTVQEFDDKFNLLYTWNSADHFEITDGDENSSYVDFKEQQIDYVHANGISIDSDTSFLISCRHMNEITKVDRRNGVIIWRLGGKNNQFQFINDDLTFSHQHSIRALDNGNILLFDNGNFRIPEFSSAVEYDIDEKNKTATLVKRYKRNPKVYSNHQGTTQRVYNGNTVINWGPYWPSVTEFHSDGTPALELDFTKHSFCPRIEKYQWQTKIFETSRDTIGFATWDSDTLFQTVWVKNNTASDLNINTIETRTEYFNMMNKLPVTVGSLDSVELKIWFNPEKSVSGYCSDVITLASDSETERIARQIKVTGHKSENISPEATILNNENFFPVDGRIQIKFTEPVRRFEGIDLDFNSVDSYIIFRKDDIDGENISFNATISSDKTLITVFPDSLLNAESVYYVSIKSGLSDYSGNLLLAFETNIETIFTGTIQPLVKDAGFKIYPNPSSSVLKIELDNSIKECSYQIYNVSGTLMEQSIVNNGEKIIEINISNLHSGIYFLAVNIKNIIITQKILKN